MKKQMEKQTHFFFAVKLPDETKFTMKQHFEKLRETFSFRSWVNDQDLHITLAFLGAASTDRLQKAQEKVSEAISGMKSLNLCIHQLGIFGKHTSPRIFFADIEPNNELQLVRQKVFKACLETGFDLETRPFRPHITLARKWAGVELFQQDQLAAWNEIQPEPLDFETEEIALYQTHLDRIPKYEAIRIFHLPTF